jgi:hypothetical protein
MSLDSSNLKQYECEYFDFYLKKFKLGSVP